MSTGNIIFWTIMIGLLSGAIAKALSPELNQGDIFLTMLVGLLGSVFLGYLGSFSHFYKFGELKGLIGSLIGAIVALTIYHFKPNQTPKGHL